ncbi:MAG: hypothetical protein QI197_06665 [Candidatus Korarchaeota archaeon]|nr:hypothetical protein [Candidatus Korarchaeota archaeon]
MGNEEKIGALVLALLLFSVAVSLMPTTIKYKYEAGPIPLPWVTGKGSYSGGISSNTISLIVDMGQVDVTADPAIREPSIVMEGISPVVEEGTGRMVAGRLALHLPDGWSGELKVRMGMGALTVRDASVRTLSVEMGMGSVEGSLEVKEKVSVKTDKGSVKLTLYVPEGVKVHVKVRALEGSVYYDGQKIEGGIIERTFGQGEKIVEVEIESYSVQLDLRLGRG